MTSRQIKIISGAENRIAELNEWEAGFITSLSDKEDHDKLSRKQVQALFKIDEKLKIL